MNILLEKFKEDFSPVDNSCNCYGCQNYTRAYLRHLFMSGEPLGIRLATMHNLRFYLNLMARIRQSIETEKFGELAKHTKNTKCDILRQIGGYYELGIGRRPDERHGAVILDLIGP